MRMPGKGSGLPRQRYKVGEIFLWNGREVELGHRYQVHVAARKRILAIWAELSIWFPDSKVMGSWWFLADPL